MNNYTDEQARSALTSLRTAPGDEEQFRHALRQRLIADNDKSSSGSSLAEVLRRHPIFAGTLAGAVTAVAILLLANGWVVKDRGEPQVQGMQLITQKDEPSTLVEPTPVLASHTMPTRRVALIKFHFSSEVAVTDVDMRIELPTGLKFWSEGRELVQSEVAWMSSLKAGVNTIPVAVYALKTGRYDVIATAEVDGKRIQHTVVLEVTDDA